MLVGDGGSGQGAAVDLVAEVQAEGGTGGEGIGLRLGVVDVVAEVGKGGDGDLAELPAGRGQHLNRQAE